MSDQTFGPNGWTPDRVGSLASRTYLITGANSGTGFEASKILLSKGAKVVMLNRNRQPHDALRVLPDDALPDGPVREAGVLSRAHVRSGRGFGRNGILWSHGEEQLGGSSGSLRARASCREPGGF